jgi:hypothetical protein
MALNPPSGIVKWYSTPLGERGWNTFRAQLTGKDYPGTSRKTSYVKLSDKEADEVIENIKKDSEGIPLFDEANAPDKAEEYQKWLVARYLTKPREEEFKNKTSKTSSEVNGGSSSVALAVVPKKEDDLVEEKIDSQILSILGLEDVFDLTYEEYASLLKEASIKGRMANSQMSTESVELVTTELKRVKGKTGKFKVNPKKVDINKVFNRKTPSPSSAIVKSQKLLPPEQLQTEEAPVSSNLQEDLTNGIGNILESLITIRTVLQSQSKTEQKAAESDRKDTEKKKKKERESTLEKKKPQSPILKALTKPVDDFFGSIKRFFTNVLLGSVVLGLFRWLKDPANQGAIDGFANFLENNAGIILGGLLAIAALPIVAPLLSLTGAITGIAIPALTAAFGFLASPAGIAALAALAATAAAATLQNVARPALQQLVGGESVTKSGLKFKYEDIVSLRNKAYDFMVKAGAPTDEVNKQIKPYEDLMATMRYKKKLNDEMFDIRKKYKEVVTRLEDEKTYENLSPLQREQLIERLKKIQNDLRNQYNQKLKEKDRSSEEIKAKFEKIGVGEDALEKAITARGGTVGRLGQPAQPQTPLMPGLPPSAAQPGSGPAGNPVGGGSVVEYITGDATHPNFEYKGHGTTENYHDHIAFKTKEDKERAKLALRQAGIQIGSENRPWDTDSYHGAGLAIDIPGAQWGGRGAIGETEYAGSRKVRAVLAAAGFSGAGLGNVGLPNAQPRPAQVARTPAPTPSIPSPTGRGNIVPLPIPTGGQQQASSGTSPNQAPVPRFSSEDPNNTTTMVVRAIYNIVG